MPKMNGKGSGRLKPDEVDGVYEINNRTHHIIEHEKNCAVTQEARRILEEGGDPESSESAERLEQVAARERTRNGSNSASEEMQDPRKAEFAADRGKSFFAIPFEMPWKKNKPLPPQ